MRYVKRTRRYSPSEAIRLARESVGDIHWVMTDIHQKPFSNKDLAAKVREARDRDEPGL